MASKNNKYKEIKLDKGGAEALYNAWNAAMVPSKKKSNTATKTNNKKKSGK